MKKIIPVILLLVLSPLLLLAFILGMAFAVCESVYSWIWLLRFGWTHADRVYLVCSRRHGWEAFLKNNAIPALPFHVTAVWLESPHRLANVIRAARIGSVVLPRPFLILVTPFGIKSTALNGRLLHLKCFGKESAQVRTDARAIIETALADFSQWYRPESG